MILIESIIGNERDGPWPERLERAEVDYLQLDQWQAQKNRFRKTTARGTELAVSLDRNSHLRDGDVLFWDGAGTAIVARISLQDVMVIQLRGLFDRAPEVLAQICFELGHAIGNQHWPAVVKGREVYVPLTIDKRVMSSVMKTHAFDDIEYSFVPGTTVIPYLAPHEARRLFGGANATPHAHTPLWNSDQVEIRQYAPESRNAVEKSS
jgi:urease accessory protein